LDRWTKALGSGVTTGNRVTPLIDGAETFSAFYAAITTARERGHYIYLLGWWLDLDQPLVLSNRESTMGVLLGIASDERNVQVRVMLWDQFLSGRKNSREVDYVNKLRNGAAILDNNTVHKWGAQHQKVLLVKGRQGLIGFCGGIDVNRDRVHVVPSSKGSPYHDVHCRIEGPGANGLADIFVQRWLAHPKHGELDKKAKLLGISDRVPPGFAGPAPENTQSVRIIRTFNCVSGGKSCAKELSVRSTMLAAIAAARKYIYIEDQYLINFQAAVALGEALKNLQHVTVVFPHSDLVDVPQAWAARKAFIAAVQSGGRPDQVRVFFRIGPAGEAPGAPHSYVHAKTWIFDDELAVIGSANCNNRGWTSDAEAGAAIFDRDASMSSKNFSFAQRLRIRLWAEHLGLSVDSTRLFDWKESAALWLNLPEGAEVRRYNPDEKKDKLSVANLVFPVAQRFDPRNAGDPLLTWFREVDTLDQLRTCQGDGQDCPAKGTLAQAGPAEGGDLAKA
jgi:phosphatidylserine/phosphatidylglycerophosphate/cardiolipin synthase-like enzyme